jgi:hypothetical protein
MFGRLPRKRRKEVRSETRKFFIARGVNVTEAQVEKHIKTEFAGILGMVMIGLATQLAWYFIKKWIDKKLKPEDVPTTYQADEPGFDEEDGED